MKWWTVYFPLCVAGCAWPVVVDAAFGDLPPYAAGQWVLVGVAVLLMATGASLLLRRAARRTQTDREPLIVGHPLFWAVVIITWSPGLSAAVVDGTWPWGGPGRAVIGAAGFLGIAVVASGAQVLLARRKRVSPRS